MIEVTVAHLGLDRTTNTPVVILREKEGARVLPDLDRARPRPAPSPWSCRG